MSMAIPCGTLIDCTGTNADELQRMVEGGMTPMQAIVATTRTAAECMRAVQIAQSGSCLRTA